MHGLRPYDPTLGRWGGSVTGELALSGLTGLLARCRVAIGNDSGPLHLAAAVGAPTVGVYWGPTSSIMAR